MIGLVVKFFHNGTRYNWQKTSKALFLLISSTHLHVCPDVEFVACDVIWLEAMKV